MSLFFFVAFFARDVLTEKLINSQSDLQIGHLFEDKLEPLRQRSQSMWPHDENTPREPADLVVFSKRSSSSPNKPSATAFRQLSQAFAKSILVFAVFESGVFNSNDDKGNCFLFVSCSRPFSGRFFPASIIFLRVSVLQLPSYWQSFAGLQTTDWLRENSALPLTMSTISTIMFWEIKKI